MNSYLGMMSSIVLALALVRGCYEGAVQSTATPESGATLIATLPVTQITATGIVERPTVSPTITPSPTTSIIEVTALGTTALLTPSIIETGEVTAIPRNTIVLEAGRYTPTNQQRVRACPSLACPILGQAGGGVTVVTEGWLINELGDIWVCLEVRNDLHGAQECAGALLWVFASGERMGNYQRN